MDSSNFQFDPNDLFYEFDDVLVRKAQKMAAQGNVIEWDLTAFGVLLGIVAERGMQYHASVKLENNELAMSCDCRAFLEEDAEVCEHALALILAWINASTAPPASKEPLLSTQAWADRGPARSTQQLWPDTSPESIRASWLNRLEPLTVKEVRELAESLRIKLKGLKREDVINGMLDVLCDPAQIRAVLERLQPDTRRLLNLLCAVWDMPLSVSSSRFGTYLQKALEAGSKTRPLKDCLAELEQFHLVEYSPSTYRLPLGILALRLPNPALFEPLPGEPARAALAQPFQFPRLALRLLLLAQGGWLVLNPAQPGDAWPNPSVRRDGEAPVPSEPGAVPPGLLQDLKTADQPAPELELAARAAEAEGLWRRARPDPTGKAGPQAPALQFQSWLRLSPQEQSLRMFQAVLSLPSSLEMDLACQQGGFGLERSTSGGLTYAHYLTQLAGARARLARLLSFIPAGQWIDLESILRTIHGLQPDWQLELNSREARGGGYRPQATIWAVSGHHRLELQEYLEWRRSYGLFHQAILTRTFHWLGLLDVGYAFLDDSQPTAVRLTPFGEFLLGRTPDFKAAQPGAAAQPLRIHPDGSLELDPDAAPFELIQLLIQIADPEGKPETPAARKSPGLPRSLRYRLNESGLGQAFDAGWTLDQITASLSRASGAELPADLLGKIQPPWERYGRLQIYEDLALVQFGDDYALPELLANTRLSQVLLYTFSPRLIAIRSEAAGDFLEELQAKGYTPKDMGRSSKIVKSSAQPANPAPNRGDGSHDR